ncbi:MAG: 3-oxoadipate enol-lactonase [Oceanicoccus sp.]|jgi:3-oxoadipate enol-lactonase
MPYANIGDISIYYEMSTPETLSASRVLFIGGTGGDLRMKPNIMNSPLAKRFTILAFDQRGLGQTRGTEGPYTMAQYADDAAALMTHVGWQTAHVYGVSFGGMVAQHLAINHPEHVDKLVLACTSCGGIGTASYPLHNIHDLQGRDRFEFMMAISDSRRNIDWQQKNPDKVEKSWLFSVAQRKEIVETEASIRGAYFQIEARKDHDTSGHLRDIFSKTFICGGKYDALAPPSNLEDLNKGIANSELSFYEGGHLFLIQDRNALKDIEAFLSGPL